MEENHYLNKILKELEKQKEELKEIDKTLVQIGRVILRIEDTLQNLESQRKW